MMEGKRRHLTNSQGRWVRGSQQRARKMIVALVMMIVGYLTFQLCLIALNTISCRSYDIDEFRTMSSNFLMTHRPVHKAPEHSTIICQLDETHSDFDRRCHFENVCWDRRESTFVYFLDASRPDAILSGTTLPNGKPRRISVKRKPGENRDGMEFLPLVERAGPIPLQNATFSDHKVHVYFTSFWAENFGHALIDDIHPLFALMYAFKLVTRDSVFLYPREVAENLHGSDKERGSRFLYELANLISDNGILRMDIHRDFSTVSSNDPGPHLFCMRHLLAGSGNLENQNTPPDIQTVGSWPSFLDELLAGWRKEIGVELEASSPFPIEAQLLVFIRKVGRRSFLNLDMLVEKSRQLFGVETLVVNPGDMPLIEQISVAQRATVTFSPCGGISFFNAFLKEGATAIIADIWHPYDKTSVSLDGHIWDRILSGHQTLRYSVRENEIMIEPPGNATAKTWWDYRDYGATMIDLDRAMHLIDRALYMAEHVFHIDTPERRART